MTALALPAPADALLAVFTDGRVLKVEDARLEGDRIVLDLTDDGVLEVPAVRIERVVADEIELTAELPAVGRCAAGWADEPLPDGLPFRSEIVAAARAADLHPWLLAAVVSAESAFDPDAVSRAGAKGLTQLMPSAAADQRVADPFDPADNLRGGASHLRGLLDRFHDLTLALAAYNAGPTTVARYEGVPPYRETHAYLRRVLGVFCPESASGRP
jgi:soluble lytic murein transglycosylase-like protein